METEETIYKENSSWSHSEAFINHCDPYIPY